MKLLTGLVSDKGCSKLLIQLSFGEWTAELEDFLELRAYHEPGLNRSIFAYFVSKIEYQKACTSIYKYSQVKEISEEDAEMALILARQTFLLLPLESQWAVLNSAVITPDSLEKEIVSKKVFRFIEDRKSLIPAEAQDDIVLSLIAFGAYKLAFEYLRIVTGEPRDRLFQELAQDYLLHKSPQPTSSAEWIDLWFEGRECVAADPTGCILKIFRESVEKEDPAERYRFYHIFLLSVLSASPDPSLLPDAFYSEYMELNINSMINTFLNFNLLKHAAKFCQLAISQNFENVSDLLVAKVSKACQSNQLLELYKSYHHR